MTYCSKCGFKIGDEMHFCPNCGTSLTTIPLSFAPASEDQQTRKVPHSERYWNMSRTLLLLYLFGGLNFFFNFLPLLFALIYGYPLKLDATASSRIVGSIAWFSLMGTVTVWWWRERQWLDRPLDKSCLPKTINMALITAGTFLFGLYTGILFYSSTWGFNSTIIVPSRDLNINTSGGVFFGLVGVVGVILFMIGLFNIYYKGR
jgi:hypothetical protein